MNPMRGRRKWRSRAAKRRAREAAPCFAWARWMRLYERCTGAWPKDVCWMMLSRLKDAHPEKLARKELPMLTLVVKHPRSNFLITNCG